MEKFIDEKPWGRVDEYEIVEEFPARYIVWNIGRANFQHEGYLPLAKPEPRMPFHVRLTDLKALKCASEEEALYILKKASSGDYPRNRKSDGITREVFNQLIREYHGE